MITLKTLSQATVQEVFNQVAKHLLTQMRQSRSVAALGGCAYRGEDQLKCAAGCLIGDDEYYIGMENKIWTSLPTIPDVHQDLISRLQRIHDHNFPNKWKRLLVYEAKERNLELEDDIFNT